MLQPLRAITGKISTLFVKVSAHVG
jgi:hypothetical protein